MFPISLDIVYLGIYLVDKTAYVFKYASCSIVCNKKKNRKRKKICVECYIRVTENDVYIYKLT